MSGPWIECFAKSSNRIGARLKPLHSDLRFKQLLKDIGLEK